MFLLQQQKQQQSRCGHIAAPDTKSRLFGDLSDDVSDMTSQHGITKTPSKQRSD